MKYIIFITVISFFCTSLFSQETKTTSVKGKGYEGYIFPMDYFVFSLDFDGVKKRITPSKEYIQKAETILNDSIDYIINGRSPNIKSKTLKKYKRQYIGFINGKGEVVIYINFLRNIDRERKSRLQKEILWILDGGDNYWQIYINIDKKELFGLLINGIA